MKGISCLLFIVACICCNGKCSKIIEKGVSRKEERIIVEQHNKVRDLIQRGKVPGQPKGKGLTFFKYDKKLAEAAQKVADTCKFEHKNIDDERWKIGVGQNLYICKSSNMTKGAHWKSAIDSWFNEHKIYKFGDAVNKKNGHYIQLVWADSKYVGCGYTFFEDSSDKALKYQKLYVCNYGPGGNVKGEKPYQKD